MLQKDACGYAKVLKKKRRKIMKKIDKCPRE
jgi:hypothetical protein